MLKDLVLKNRSYRRFSATHKIARGQVEQFIDAARLCPSAANKQPLKYYIACDEAANKLIFPHLKWAAMLKDWSGPAKNERPSAYIVILADKTLWLPMSVNDVGIAAQTILLAAVEDGLGGCMISNFSADAVKTAILCGNNFDPVLVIALGMPDEEVVLEPVKEGKTSYYRDERDNHHVPKRTLDEVLIN